MQFQSKSTRNSDSQPFNPHVLQGRSQPTGLTPRQFRKMEPRGNNNSLTKNENIQLHHLQLKKIREKQEFYSGGETKNLKPQEISGNEKLPADVQAKMETSFNTSFNDVKINKSAYNAEKMGALAFTQGNEIHFAPGQYQPQTSKGLELIGHELTHVVQQKEGRVKAGTQAQGMAINNESVLENEADKMGKKVARGEKVSDGKAKSDKSRTTVKTLQAQMDQESLDQIAPQQMIYEFAAHHLAYKAEGQELDESEKDFLFTNGYAREVQYYGLSTDASYGFQAVVIKSISDKNDLIAIRGTIPGMAAENLFTLYVDLDPVSVGKEQFDRNSNLIEEILNTADGKADITGHSLGGAMAQHIAVNFPDKIANVSTFQSPGIDQASVNTFNEIPEEERANVTHHIVSGDLIDKAGEASLPGDVYEHDFGWSLDIVNVLNNLTSEITVMENSIRSMKTLSSEILTIIAYSPAWTFLPGDQMNDVFIKMQELQQHKNNMESALSRFRQQLSDTVSDVKNIGKAHGAFAFTSNYYEPMRGDLNFPDDHLSNQVELNREATITAHSEYPHQDQRALAEPIRQSIGHKIQSVFRAVIYARQGYELTIQKLNAFKNGVTQGVNTVHGIVTNTFNSAIDRIRNLLP